MREMLREYNIRWNLSFFNLKFDLATVCLNLFATKVLLSLHEFEEKIKIHQAKSLNTDLMLLEQSTDHQQ